MSLDIKKLREQRNAAVTAMKDLVLKAEEENRGFTADDDAAWSKAEADIADLDKLIERAERASEIAAAAPAVPGVIAATAGDVRAVERGTLDEGAVFRKYLRAGIGGLSADEAAFVREKRAFTAGTNNTGGYTVPQGFVNNLETALKATGGMWAAADLIRTDTGNVLPWPTLNYTGVSGTRVSEGGAGTADSSTPFGVVNFNAYTYRSSILQVSWEFLQDTAFGDQFIIDALTESLWRITNTEFTIGTGTSQPQGVVTGAISGATAATGNTTTMPYDTLVDLVHSVDSAYRAAASSSLVPEQASQQQYGGRVGFMMRDATVAALRKLKDSQNMPIWAPSYQEGVRGGVPDRLLGYPVYVNQDVAAMAANAKSVLFGRFDKYKIRLAAGAQVLRLTERYADSGQVAFIVFLRADGRLLDAGTNPIKYAANSAT